MGDTGQKPAKQNQRSKPAHKKARKKKARGGGRSREEERREREDRITNLPHKCHTAMWHANRQCRQRQAKRNGMQKAQETKASQLLAWQACMACHATLQCSFMFYKSYKKL